MSLRAAPERPAGLTDVWLKFALVRPVKPEEGGWSGVAYVVRYFKQEPAVWGYVKKGVGADRLQQHFQDIGLPLAHQLDVFDPTEDWLVMRNVKAKRASERVYPMPGDMLASAKLYIDKTKWKTTLEDGYCSFELDGVFCYQKRKADSDKHRHLVHLCQTVSVCFRASLSCPKPRVTNTLPFYMIHAAPEQDAERHCLVRLACRRGPTPSLLRGDLLVALFLPRGQYQQKSEA
jgi:hypothetical protein